MYMYRNFRLFSRSNGNIIGMGSTETKSFLSVSSSLIHSSLHHIFI